MTKTTSFGGKKVVMYSIDGLIWSTRKDELAGIKHRLDTQKVTLDLTAKEDEEKNPESEQAEGIVAGEDAEVAAAEGAKSKVKSNSKKNDQKIKQVAKGKAAKVKATKIAKNAKKNSGKRKAA